MTENHPEILTGDQIKDLNDAKRGESFGHAFAHVLEKAGIHRRSRMSQLKRIIVGYDLAAGGETALKSAVVLANRYGAAFDWCM